MIHRVGIIAPIEPGILASLQESFDREVKWEGVVGHKLELYILESYFDKLPFPLEFILNQADFNTRPVVDVPALISKFPEYVKATEYREGPYFEQLTPLGSLQRNHKKYKKRGKR